MNFNPDSKDERTLYEVLIGRYNISDIILDSEIKNLKLAPSHINLVGAEIEMLKIEEREMVMKRAIASVLDKFDYIIIDCSPSLGLITINSLTASDSDQILHQPQRNLQRRNPQPFLLNPPIRHPAQR